MVQTQRVFEEIEDAPQRDAGEFDNRKVDIVSEVEPEGGAKDLVVSILFLTAWCAIAVGIGITALAIDGPGIFVIVPFLFGAFGIAMMWSEIGPVLRAKRVLRDGSEYSAEVIGYGRRTVEHTYSDSDGSSSRTEKEEKITMKVLATIDGKEQCILLKAPDSGSELTHPIGCTVTIVGYDRDFLMKID